MHTILPSRVGVWNLLEMASSGIAIVATPVRGDNPYPLLPRPFDRRIQSSAERKRLVL